MCTEGPDIIIIVLGVVGGVVGVGLILLLLVKLLTSLFDRLEYQTFVKELQSPKWAKVSAGQGQTLGQAAVTVRCLASSTKYTCKHK